VHRRRPESGNERSDAYIKARREREEECVKERKSGREDEWRRGSSTI